MEKRKEEFIRYWKMFRVVLECKNVKLEKLAEKLSKLTNGFKIWTHNEAIYAVFEIGSLLELKLLSKGLRNFRKIGFRFVKLQTVSCE